MWLPPARVPAAPGLALRRVPTSVIQSEFNLLLGTGVLALAIGIGIPVLGPGVTGGALAAAISVPLVFSHRRIRAAFVIFGGLVAFQSTAGLSTPKIVYLVGVLLCAAAGLLDLSRSDTRDGLLRALWPLAGLVLVVVGISAVIAQSNGIPFTAWARDTLAYLFLAYVPLFAADVGRAGPKFTHNLAMTAGILAVALFTLAWVSRRGYADVPILGLASFLFPAWFFSYVTSLALLTHRFRWNALAVATAVAMLLTGTRGVALLAIAPLAMALVPSPGSTRGLLRLGAITLVVGAGAFLALQSTNTSVPGIERIVTGDRGLSLQERDVARTAVLRKIEQAPVLGSGAGTSLYSAAPYSVANSGRAPSTADTILTTAAKYGCLGLLAFLIVITGYCLLPLRFERSPAGLSGVGFLAVTLCHGALASPLEDKGFAFALMAMLAIIFASRHHQESGVERVEHV